MPYAAPVFRVFSRIFIPHISDQLYQNATTVRAFRELSAHRKPRGAYTQVKNISARKASCHPLELVLLSF